LARAGADSSPGHRLRYVVVCRRHAVTGEPQLHGYRGEQPPPRFNMAAYAIGRAASTYPNKPALLVLSDPKQPPAEIWTFAEIEAAIRRIAAALNAEGLAPGARIMIRLENTSTYALLFFGAIAAGYV